MSSRFERFKYITLVAASFFTIGYLIHWFKNKKVPPSSQAPLILTPSFVQPGDESPVRVDSSGKLILETAKPSPPELTSSSSKKRRPSRKSKEK